MPGVIRKIARSSGTLVPEDSAIVARHEVPGIIRKIARPSGTIEPISA